MKWDIGVKNKDKNMQYEGRIYHQYNIIILVTEYYIKLRTESLGRCINEVFFIFCYKIQFFFVSLLAHFYMGSLLLMSSRQSFLLCTIPTSSCFSRTSAAIQSFHLVFGFPLPYVPASTCPSSFSPPLPRLFSVREHTILI